jgi:TolB-like protein
MKRGLSVLMVLSLVSCVSVQDKMVTPAELASFEVLGPVEAAFTTYQFFHIYSSKSIKKKAYTRLLTEAKKYYQGDIDVINITCKGSFSALTLLPLPNAYGFISNFQTVRARGTVIGKGGGTQRAPGTASRPSTSIEIDRAIAKTSTDLIDDLTARSRINLRIAVLNVASNNSNLSAYVVEELEYQLVSSRKFTIVDRNALDAIRREQNFQMSGDVSDDSAVSIGQMLGANIVITGSITGAGTNQRLSIRALDVRTAEIITIKRADF